ARGRALALGTVPIAAAVVGDHCMGAVLAACHMPTEGRRTAALDSAHHLELVEAHAAAVGMAPRGPVAAEDVRDLQSWPGHAGPLRRWSDYSLWYERREPVQRAHDLANEVGGHLGVARRRVELGMPEQDLKHANVDVLLQQMRGEAVPQCVRRHALLDPCGLGGGMDGAIELTGRQRLDRVAAGKQPAP